ncbi:hypothetical protein [Nitrosomonas sp.]|uniref:hypothetical protein n=1 Tax=Nitrosomonas sp. TaxID=42353 RepID=UPI001DB53593|nr:hypothetical protein [Nitrosomonas sp.]MBX3615547.1 hypothetical protein [Nitrosomonas sp.]
MKTILVFLILIIATPVLADAEKTAKQGQLRQLETELNRVQQESQSIYQQFLMIQELRRNDVSEPSMNVPLPSTPGQSIPIPNYDDLFQRQQERKARIDHYSADLDRLYARYQELENEKQQILEQIDSLNREPEE